MSSTELPPVTPLLPTPTMDSQGFWDGLNAGELRIQRCNECGKLRHYPRPVCPYCFSMESGWRQVSGKGKVHSWTTCHHAFHDSFRGRLPYVLVIVDLDEGVRMQSQLVNPPDDAQSSVLTVGAPVEVVFEQLDADNVVPLFRLTETA